MSDRDLDDSAPAESARGEPAAHDRAPAEAQDSLEGQELLELQALLEPQELRELLSPEELEELRELREAPESLEPSLPEPVHELREPRQASPTSPAARVQDASRGAALKTLVVRLIPWASLIASVVGAVIMDRSERRGALVAGAIGAAWVAFAVVSLAHRKGDAAATGAMRKALRFASTAANQSLLQMSLFFSAPFYAAAAAYTVPQILFFVVLGVACLATLWDPLFEWVLLHPFAGALLMAFASFIGWNAALPMLGMPHRDAVWLAAAAVALALPAVRYAQGSRGRAWLASLAAGALFPVLLLAGGLVAVPAAPLRVVQAAIGTQVEDRELIDPQRVFHGAPEQLLCWTAIHAPAGLAEKLTHVWSKDGEVLSRIELTLRGGRSQGFRTWSRLRLHPGSHGRIRCEVVTDLGQTLSQTSVLLSD